MDTSQALSASLEDYLEAIFRIVSEKRVAARSRDIAARLAVKGASVTGALRSLAERELVNYEPYGAVTLTAAGRKAAIDVVRRHEALRDFLLNVLGVEREDADHAACQLEHGIPRPVFARLVHFVQFLRTCPRVGQEWIAHFRELCERADGDADCEACILQCLDTYRQDPSQAESRG